MRGQTKRTPVFTAGRDVGIDADGTEGGSGPTIQRPSGPITGRKLAYEIRGTANISEKTANNAPRA